MVWPGNQRTSLPADFLRPLTPARPAKLGTVRPIGVAMPAPTARRGLPGVRHLVAVVAAVYAALSDPLAATDDEGRERRAVRARRVGMIAAGAVLSAVLIYSIFPVRTYLDQRAASDRARERLEVITEENERLAEQVEEYNDPETIEEIARRDYGMVLPEEESYGVLPPPTETTTTAPTTTVPTPP